MALQTHVSSLAISVSGERIRGLIHLRVTDLDRYIERSKTVASTMRAELERLQGSVAERVGRATGAEVPAFSGYHGRVNLDDIGEVKRRIERVTDRCDALVYERAKLVWLRDTIAPSETYTMTTHDLMAMGFGDVADRTLNALLD